MNTTMLKEISRVFVENVPFTKEMQIKVVSLTKEEVTLTLPMSPLLVGNFVSNRLHGGVAATVLDSAGGLLCMANVYYEAQERNLNAQLEDLGKVGTIDLRIDYLNSGRGELFTATGQILRAGNRIITVQLALHNEKGIFIAAGTGTYAVVRTQNTPA